MKRLIIRNLEGQQTHGPVDSEDPSTWIAECVASNAWGKSERWVMADQEDVTGAIETREIIVTPEVPAVIDDNGVEISPAIPAVTKEEFLLKATYSIEIIDVTQEYIQAAKVEFGLKAQSFGAEMIAFIYAINESKGLSVEQFSQMMENNTIANIERCLWNGAIETARSFIVLPEIQLYFSAAEVISVLEKIDAFLAANGRAVQ